LREKSMMCIHRDFKVAVVWIFILLFLFGCKQSYFDREDISTNFKSASPTINSKVETQLTPEPTADVFEELRNFREYEDIGISDFSKKIAEVHSYNNAISIKEQTGIRLSTNYSTIKKVIQDEDGNYIAVGCVESSIGYFLNKIIKTKEGDTSINAVIIKYDSNLNVLNSSLFNINKSFDNGFMDVLQNSSGNYVAVGYGYDDLEGIFKGVIVEYDKELNIIHSAADNVYVSIYNSIVENENSYVIAGASGNLSTMSTLIDQLLDLTTDTQGAILEYDESLNFIEESVGFYSTVANLTDIIKDKNNDYIVVGSLNSDFQGNNCKEGLILKINSNLEQIAHNIISNPNNSDVYFDGDIQFRSVVENDEGDYIVCRSCFYSDEHADKFQKEIRKKGIYPKACPVVVSFSNNLMIKKQLMIDNTVSEYDSYSQLDEGFCEVINTNSGYVFAGYSNFLKNDFVADHLGDYCYIVIFYDKNFNMVKSANLESTWKSEKPSIILNKDGNIVLAGLFKFYNKEFDDISLQDRISLFTNNTFGIIELVEN